MGALGGVIFVVALLLSIVLHEAGHFVTARAFGMKATQFFVGFGPTLFSRRRGETEYGIKAIPAGGYVKIIGMVPTEEVDAADEPRAFWRQPAPQRTIVLAAGSFTHLVVGFMLILGVAFFSPLDRGPGLSVSTVTRCVTVDLAVAPTATDAGCGTNGAPAPAAGVLRAGDRVTTVDGAAVASWDDFTSLVRRHPGQTLRVGLVRDGRATDVVLTPATVQRTLATGEPGDQSVGALGVSPAYTYASPTWNEAWSRAGRMLGFSQQGIIGATARGFVQIPDKFGQIFSADRTADGPASVVGITRFSAQTLGDTAEPLAVRIAQLLLLIASVNIFVGILNLLPLLPFDGGHIALVAVDKAREGVARLRRRPIPARIDYARVAPLSYAVFLVIVVASFLVIAADIGNPVKI